MRRAISGIDHVVIAVRDLERAAKTYSRLGFTLTPRGVHTLGSQNHCIMFGSDYLELLAVPRAHPANQHYLDFLNKGEGLAGLAFATPSADAAFAELSAAGVEAEAALEFSRPVALVTGPLDARFRVVQLPCGATPGCRAFLCQHYTRELVWREEWQAHRIGATGIAAIAMIANDALSAGAAYGRLLDEKPQAIDEGVLVRSGDAPIAVCTRGRLGRRLEGVELPARTRPLAAALFIRVADRAKAARTLKQGGFEPVALKDGSFAVGAGDAHGVALVFG